MELKRILARDTRSATEKAMALYGPDVLIISNQRVEGQTELIVALEVAEVSAEELMQDEELAMPAVQQPASTPTKRLLSTSPSATTYTIC
ncbi:MAG: Signal recognition particle 54 kDa protein [Pseudomonadota bacterium]